jgi:hypothetical protein
MPTLRIAAVTVWRLPRQSDRAAASSTHGQSSPRGDRKSLYGSTKSGAVRYRESRWLPIPGSPIPSRESGSQARAASTGSERPFLGSPGSLVVRVKPIRGARRAAHPGEEGGLLFEVALRLGGVQRTRFLADKMVTRKLVGLGGNFCTAGDARSGLFA